MNERRRTLLRTGGLALAGALAGCSGLQGGGDDTPASTDTSADGTPTPTASGEAPPGADVLGAEGDLQSSATVRAAVLDEDRGAGQFVFTPAVVWLEPGGTVTWEIEGAAHSVTAYHPEYDDRPQRIPEDAEPFDSGNLDAGETYEYTVETEGVYNYFCRPHEGLGMVGVVVVGAPQGGPGTTPPENVGGEAGTHLEMQLEAAGILGGGGGQAGYGWQAAAFDAYWYSLYNMSTNISMSGNGVLFPHNEQQQQAFDERFPKMLEAAGEEHPPVKNPNLNMAPFTEGSPRFTEEPVLSGEDGRPDASTLAWDPAESSKVVSPSSVAWTHLKGVTWAKNFENHFDVLPDSLAAEFRSMVLSTLAQIGTAATLVEGGPDENGALTRNDENLLLVSEFRPGDGTVVDDTPRPNHHSAMLWFLSDLVSLAHGGWFGYENPEPLIPPENVQTLADGMAETTMNAFDPGDVVDAGSTRDLGQMLGAVGWYGTHAGNADVEANAADYADALAAEVEANLAGNGRVDNGADNQAATQGIVGQGLLWASEIEGVDHAGTAGAVLGYLLDELWDDDAGTFACGEDAATYTYTARDAGDVTGGLNAADHVLGMDGVRDRFARFFDATFNRGRLQRAERSPSRDADAEHTLPLPPAAGGEYGRAAVYNGAVEYDVGADEWTVTDERFYTADALYLANQDIWVGHWGGDFFRGRGVPGTNDSPE